MDVFTKIDQFFGIRSSGSSFTTEARAGVTTFVTMAYILFVNPSILGQAVRVDGVDLAAQLLVTTALVSGIGSWLMAFVARYPFALAPGMGTNAYFAFAVVLGLGIPWQIALGAVFVSGVLFLILSLLRIRETIVRIFPHSLKLATTVGMGLFLALLGLENSGLIVKHDVTLVTLGNLRTPESLVSLFGLVLTMILLVRRIRGAILIGILATTAFALLGQFPLYNGSAFSGWSGSLLQLPPWPKDLFLALDIRGSLNWEYASIIFIFLFVGFFDTAGALVGLSQASDVAGKKLEGAAYDACFFVRRFGNSYRSFVGIKYNGLLCGVCSRYRRRRAYRFYCICSWLALFSQYFLLANSCCYS